MSTPTGEPPFLLDGNVSVDKLRDLLAVGTELAWLDYKSECDLSTAEGKVAIAKDVGAMHIRGGYLVIGAEGTGQGVGIPEAHAKHFDEAQLRAKLAKYLGTAGELRSAVHDLADPDNPDGVPTKVALIWVGVHPDGFCIFACDGQYDDRGKSRTVFRKGEVYARHGTSSEPWSQADIIAVRETLVSRVKDQWRAEHAEQIRVTLDAVSAQTTAITAPSAAFTWQLPLGDFEDATVELMRRSDDIPLRRMLRAAQAEAAELLEVEGSDAADELVALLDHVTVVAALALDLDRGVYLDLVLEALLALYDAGITRENATSGRRSAWLWVRVAERLYALGALALRKRNWPTVRRIVQAPLNNLNPLQTDDRTWHRHAVTKASWAGLLQESTTNGPRRLSLLMFARATAVAIPALRPDLPGRVELGEPANHDPLLTSLCQFDLLATVISGIGATNQHELLDVSYPNYARYYGQRVRPIVAALISDPQLRGALLPDADDPQLAQVLWLAGNLADREARSHSLFRDWDGYGRDVTEFVAHWLPATADRG